MKAPVQRIVWLAALVSAACRPATTPAQEERFFVGSLVDGMRQNLQLHEELRGRRADQLSEDEQILLHHALVDLRARRTGLELSLPKLPGDNHELQVFLARWTREGLEDGLLAAPSPHASLDTDLKRLARLYPQNQYRSPFARFPKVR